MKNNWLTIILQMKIIIIIIMKEYMKKSQKILNVVIYIDKRQIKYFHCAKACFREDW